MRRIDPLPLLGKAIRAHSVLFLNADGQPVEDMKESTHIQLDGWIFARDIPTTFRSKRGTGPPYALDVVCVLLVQGHSEATSSYTEYVQDSRKAGVGVVSLVDKKDLVGYVMDGNRSNFIDETAEMPMAYRSWTELTSGVGGTESITDEQEETVGDSKALESGTFTIDASTQIKLYRPLKTRESILWSGKDFGWVIPLMKESLETEKPHRKEETTLAKQPVVSLIDQLAKANQPSPSQRRHARSKTSGPPIIIVPVAPTAMLNMYNIKQFLIQSTYIPPAEAKASHVGPKEWRITVEHGKRPVQIIDNPLRLESIDDWSRVVAVFVHGPIWQFKGWKWTGGPAEIFQRVRGFHLYYEDAGPDPAVTGWNVTNLPISRSRRHLDATAVFKFWQQIDEALGVGKR